MTPERLADLEAAYDDSRGGMTTSERVDMRELIADLRAAWQERDEARAALRELLAVVGVLREGDVASILVFMTLKDAAVAARTLLGEGA